LLSILFIIFGFGVIFIYIYTHRARNREDLSVYDQHSEPLFSDAPASSAHIMLASFFNRPIPFKFRLSQKQIIKAMRQKLDEMGTRVEISSAIINVESDNLSGEWIVASNADPDKRLLYIHGGAFFMGSPKSHRIIASKFSEVSQAAVFVVDYRLRPENERLEGLTDCKNAYHWIQDQGPNGIKKASELFVAGDSAGGNLCLSLLSWIRDKQLLYPKAAVCLSPVTDSTLSSPSIKRNIDRDLLLSIGLKPILHMPRILFFLLGRWRYSVCLADPQISPVFGDLSNLPPLLIHASNAECLEDDARRYTNKARMAGSDVRLQIWANMMHVWHMFEPELKEAKTAFKEIEKFLDEVTND